MCVPFEYDCPIISLKEGTPHNQNLIDRGFTEVELNPDSSLYYSSNDEDGGMPISEFILSEGQSDKEKACINKEDFIVPLNKEIYPLLNTNFYKGCSDTVDGLMYVIIFNLIKSLQNFCLIHQI